MANSVEDALNRAGAEQRERALQTIEDEGGIFNHLICYIAARHRVNYIL